MDVNLTKFTKTQQEKILNSLTVTIDTREHEGKHDHIINYFDKREIPWVRQKLNAGDYSMLIPANEDLGIENDLDFSNDIMVERKMGLEELSKNYSSERDRMKAEFNRAPQHKILLVENSKYSDLINGKYNTQFPPKSFWASIFSMWHRYDIPTIFLEDKKYAGQYIYGYLYYYLYNVLKGRIT